MHYVAYECATIKKIKAIKSIKGIITEGLIYESIYKLEIKDKTYYELEGDDNSYHRIKSKYFIELVGVEDVNEEER